MSNASVNSEKQSFSTKDYMKKKHSIVLMMTGLYLDFLAVPVKTLHMSGSVGHAKSIFGNIEHFQKPSIN